MSDKHERNVNNGSIAAALGVAVAADDISNVGNTSNSNNSHDSSSYADNDYTTSDDDTTVVTTTSDNDVTNSNNSSDDDLAIDVGLTDVLNDKSVTTTTNTSTVNDQDVSASYNQDNDQDNDTTTVSTSTSTSVDVALTDAFNDKSVSDSYNQDNDTAVADSYNTSTVETTITTTISDAFKLSTSDDDSDDDWLELDGVNFDVLAAVGEGALAGAGNDAMFLVSQVSEMIDNDTLYSPSVSNNSDFHVSQHGDGGKAYGSGDSSEIGDRGTSSASANGTANLEAFTQNIVMGANIQYNNFNATVVGGDSSVMDGDIG